MLVSAASQRFLRPFHNTHSGFAFCPLPTADRTEATLAVVQADTPKQTADVYHWAVWVSAANSNRWNFAGYRDANDVMAGAIWKAAAGDRIHAERVQPNPGETADGPSRLSYDIDIKAWVRVECRCDGGWIDQSLAIDATGREAMRCPNCDGSGLTWNESSKQTPSRLAGQPPIA